MPALSVSPILLVVLLLAAIAVAAGWWLLRRRSRRPEGPPEAPAVPRPVPEPEALRAEARRRAAVVEDLEELHRRLGFSPLLEARIDDELDGLVEALRVEIPDPEALARALDAVAARSDSLPDLEPAAAQLLQEALAARSDPPRLARLLVERLGRDPVRDLLPFVERLPLERDHLLVWRTPMALDLVRKRPANPGVFRSRLENLETTVRSARLERPPRSREAVLEVLSRLRGHLGRDGAYFPTPLLQLEEKLREWLVGAAGQTARARRREVEELVAATLAFEHRWGRLGDASAPLSASSLSTSSLSASSLASIQEEAQALARRYLEAPWMECDWLGGRLLTALLVSELAAHPGGEPGSRTGEDGRAPAAVLRRVVAEVASGRFDALETARRLHGLEERGVWVHSLVYGLLRRADPESRRPAIPTPAGSPRGSRRGREPGGDRP